MMDEIVQDALYVSGVAKERVKIVGKKPPRKLSSSLYVLYWMTSSFRSKQNESLEVAKAIANKVDLPLVVVAGVDLEHYRQGSIRHVLFLLEGLSELEKSLRIKNVHLTVRVDPPAALADGERAVSVLGIYGTKKVTGFERHAHIIVMDKQFLRHPRQANTAIAVNADCAVLEVDSRLAIPVEVATSDGTKFIDPDTFTKTFWETSKKYCSEITCHRVARKTVLCDLTSLGYHWSPEQSTWTADDWMSHKEELVEVLDQSGVNTSVAASTGGLYYGGEFSARKLLNIFLAQRIASYKQQHEENGEEVRVEYGSMLGPYISFGFLSAADILLKLYSETKSRDSVTTWSQNLAKRELAYHMCYYTPGYDSFEQLLPKPLQQLLTAYANHRTYEHRYSVGQWERGETMDEEWNIAQREMLKSGKGMRSDRKMWCQTIIERERDPGVAFNLAVHLNDKYMLDALDPCSITGVV